MSPPFDAYRAEKARLLSFREWSVPFIDKAELARYGFYFQGPDDMVKCYFCNVQIGLWEPNDIVLCEHLKWSPYCPLLRKQTTNNLPINPGFLDDLPDPVNDVAGSGEMRLANGPKYPQFAIEAARFSSYEYWPKQMNQSPQKLSDAGFFYTGSGDKVKCFMCGGGLYQWEPNDDPWEQHAFCFRQCEYLKLVKGESYILDCLKKMDITGKTEDDRIVEVQSEIKDEFSRCTADHTCKICWIEKYNTVFLPCGHVAACGKCAAALTECPICRQPASKTSIYLV